MNTSHRHGPHNTAAFAAFSHSGRKAYAAGLTPKDCPLKEGSRARAVWIAGWHDAKRDAEAKKGKPDG